MKTSTSFSENLVIAVAQMTSTDQIEDNVEQVFDLLKTISKDHSVRLVCFPENSLFMRLKEGAPVQSFNFQHSVFKRLGDWCKAHNLFIHLGSVPLVKDDLCFNSSVLIKDNGEAVASYDKMHLFDISLENGPSMKESDTFSHGQKPKIFEIDGWKLGQTICYDLRFSELYSFYAEHDVDVILVPSSFLVKTGQAHWHILLRARAIESQCYVVASAQSGTHRSASGQRETYGHSLVVDPWGAVVSEQTSSPSLAIVCLEKNNIQKVRRQIPMKSHRRQSLKTKVD